MAEKRWALGLDVGGTKLSVSLGCLEDGEVRVVDKIKLPTPKGDYVSALEKMKEACETLLCRGNIPKTDLVGVGISCGGPLDSQRGVVLSPPNLIGWDQVEITRFYQEKLGVPAWLQNDADACTLAEWRFGAGRGCRNMIFLTFGTGFGAGLILDGRLYTGSHDMAGEVGHCRAPQIDGSPYRPVGYGKCGSFEGYCSGGGIAQLGRSLLLEKFQRGETVSFCAGPEELDDLTAKTIGDAADAGDETATEIYRISGRYLGASLAVLVDILDPDRIVIGSIYARSTALLRDSALEILKRESLPRENPCQILPGELGEQMGDIAALSVAFNRAEG